VKVPYHFAEDIVWGRWVCTQRCAYKLKKISLDKQEHLNSLEFVWNASTPHRGRYINTAARIKPVSRVGMSTARTGMPKNTHRRRTARPIRNPEAAVRM
jgi:hypothetical protein